MDGSAGVRIMPGASPQTECPYGAVALVFVATLVVALGCSDRTAQSVTSAQAQAIEQHLREVYAIDSDPRRRLRKWTNPIRYVVLGKTHERAEEIIHNSFRLLSSITGVAVRNDPAVIPRETNVLIVFTDDFDTLSRLPNVKRIFQSRKETDEEYERKVRQIIRDGAIGISKFLYRPPDERDNEGLSPLFVASIYMTRRLPAENLESYLLAEVFTIFAQTFERSNVVVPSLTNSGTVFSRNALPEPSKFDRALLEVLYSSEVKSGIALEAAIEVMARRVAERRYGKGTR